MTNTTSGTLRLTNPNMTASIRYDSWNSALLATEIIVFVIIAATVWVSLSMIFFGTQTRRWKKNRGTSSLNSGMIYTTCFIAVIFTLTKLIFTLIYHYIPRKELAYFPCEIVLDVMSAVYFFGLFLMYLYLWMVQRRIYTHPSVKTHVGSFMNRVSKFSVIFLAVAFATVAVLYGNIDNSEYQLGNGCMLVNASQTSRLYLSMTCGAVATVTQILMLGLCIYPAARARFPVASQEGALVTQDKTTVPVAMKTQRINCCKLLCWRDIGASPIQLTVNRTLVGSLIIVVTDIVSTLTEAFILSRVTPLVLHTVVYDINSFINVIAMLYILGFAGRLWTLFCPTCPQSIKVVKSHGETFNNKNTEV